MVEQGWVGLQLLNKVGPSSWFQALQLIQQGEVKVNFISNHLVGRSCTVQMSPNRNFIWSLIGFFQIEDMGLVILNLPPSSNLQNESEVSKIQVEV